MSPQPPPSPPRRPRALTIRARLAALVALSILAAVVLGTALGAVQEAARTAASARAGLLAAAHGFAAAAAPGAAAGDAERTGLALRGAGRLPGFAYAMVEGPDGALLAEFGAGARLSGDAAPLREGEEAGLSGALRLLASRSLAVEVALVNAGEPAGRLVLVASTEGIGARLVGALAAALAGGAVALALGLLVAARLQRGLADPLARLAEAMREARDGAPRGRPLAPAGAGGDEVSQLLAGFDAMQDALAERDERLAAHAGALAEHARGLERAVEARTRELRLATRAAESANEAKSAFLAAMSHEIRTPMNGVLAMTELLEAGELSPAQRRRAGVIARSGRALVGVIDDVLDLARVEAGAVGLEDAPFDPAAVAFDVVALFHGRAKAKGLDIALAVAPDVPALLVGDAARVGQVLSNLVGNAVKFTARGHVLVQLGPDPSDPARLRLAVIDTGPGIARHRLAAVFEPFAQEAASTARNHGGSGLGLAIGRRLAEAMGGALTASSEEGRGSAFALALPLRGAAARPAPAPAPGRPRALVALGGAGGGLTATSRAAADALAARGYAVERVDAGGLGEALGAGPAALVVGEAAALARLPARPAPAVIALGEGGEGGEAPAGADALLALPLAPRELEALLDRLAAGEPLGAPLPAAAGPAALPRLAGRVLVADDGEVNREVALEALAALGLSAVAVADGRAALEAVRAGGIDLVLMDGDMPVMDGFAAARAIRAAEGLAGAPRLPILALTAHAVGPAALAWRDAGMDGAVTKPFTLARLAAAMTPFLRGGAGEGEGEGEPPAVADAGSCPPPDRAAGEPPQDGLLLDVPLLDEAVLGATRALGRGAGGLMGRVAGLYAAHAPAALAALGAADGPAARASAAHALRSMSLSLGAARVAALAGALERRARAGEGPDAAALAALAAALDATLAALGEDGPRDRAGAAGGGDGAALAG